MDFADLPHLNAFLNVTSACLLLLGYAAIRRKNTARHARFMVAAFAMSVLFLISYVTYHYTVRHTTFPGSGALRVTYLAILFSHIVLAVVTLPLAVITLVLALRKRFVAHRRIAPWTFFIWMYVSVTGVVVYLMLYHLPHGS